MKNTTTKLSTLLPRLNPDLVFEDYYNEDLVDVRTLLAEMTTKVPSGYSFRAPGSFFRDDLDVLLVVNPSGALAIYRADDPTICVLDEALNCDGGMSTSKGGV